MYASEEDEEQKGQDNQYDELRRIEKWNMELDNYGEGEDQTDRQMVEFSNDDSLLLANLQAKLDNRRKALENEPIRLPKENLDDSREHDFDGFDEEYFSKDHNY